MRERDPLPFTCPSVAQLPCYYRPEAEGLARSWGVTYEETSAKTKYNVDKIYYDLVSRIRDKKAEAGAGASKKKKKKKCTIL